MTTVTASQTVAPVERLIAALDLASIDSTRLPDTSSVIGEERP